MPMISSELSDDTLTTFERSILQTQIEPSSLACFFYRRMSFLSDRWSGVWLQRLCSCHSVYHACIAYARK